MRRLLPFVFLAACASAPKPAPVVSTPDAQPMVRVSPASFEMCLVGQDFPYRAQVEVKLATTPDGFVSAAEIVDSSDSCLNGPVLKAVNQWRYPPLMVDDQLVAREDIRAIIRIVAEAEPQ